MKPWKWLLLFYVAMALILWYFWAKIKGAIGGFFGGIGDGAKALLSPPESQNPNMRSTYDSVKGLAYASQGDRALSDLWDTLGGK